MREIRLLVNRHLRIYFSSWTNLFFTLFSNFISIAVYLLFLFDNSVNSIKQYVPVEQLDNVSILMLLFLISGQIMVMVISASLANTDLIIKDTQYTGSDMSVWPISKTKIMLSYLIQTAIITIGFSLITLMAGLSYVYFSYDYYLSITIVTQVVGIIIISSIFSSLMAVLFTSMMKNLRSYGSFSTIINTLSGFLLGIYVPLGILPNFVQKIVLMNPYFNYMYLFRNIMMKDIVEVTFEKIPVEVKNNVLEVYGLLIDAENQIFSMNDLPIVMGISFVLILIVTLLVFRKKQIVR